MFKKLLSLAALALCAGSMNAQLEAGKDYIFQNVEAETFLGGGNDWGTHASLNKHGQIFTAEVSGDGFKLNSHVYNSATNHYLGSDYIDNGGQVWTAEAVDGGYALKNDGGTYLAPGDGTKVVTGSSTASAWKIIPISAIFEGATATNPVDVTAIIKNANFSRNSYAAVMNNGTQSKYEDTYPWTITAGNYNLMGGDNVNMNAESWRSTFDISQTLTVPNGIYTLNAQAALTDYTDAYDGTDYPVVYANAETTPFKAMEGDDIKSTMTKMSASFTAGKYQVTTITVVVTDGTLTVGVKGTRTDTWCIWDNFELYYFGPASDDAALAVAKDAYDKANAAANAVDTTQKMSASASQDLAKAKDTYGDNSFSTVEAYETATNALNDAAKAANESIADYASQKAQCEAYEKKSDAAGIQDAMESFSTDFWDCYNAGSLHGELSDLISEYDQQISALLQGTQDMTSKITNPSFESSVDGWTTVEGWQNANPYFHTNSSNVAVKVGNNFVEGWVPTPNGHGDETLTQTLADMPAGEYYLTVNAKNEQQAGNTIGKGFFVTIGDKQYEVYSTTNDECFVYFKLDNKGEITIGLKVEGCTGNWIAADDFHLYFKGDLDKSIVEGKLKDAKDLYDTLDSTKDYAQALDQAITSTTNDLKNVTTPEELDNLATELQKVIDAAKAGARRETYVNVTDGKYLIAESTGFSHFLGAANSWGTQASIICHPEVVELIKQENGKYYIKSQVSNGGDSQYFNGSYMDGAATEIEIIGSKGDDDEDLEGYTYYNINLSNGKDYYIVADEATVVSTTTDVPEETNWVLISVDEYEKFGIAEFAHKYEEWDFTHRILDNNFGRNNVGNSAWERTPKDGDNDIVKRNGENENSLFESWHTSSFFMKQTIKGLPKGLYLIVATAFHTNADANPVMVVNDGKYTLPLQKEGIATAAAAAAKFAEGEYEIDACVFIEEDDDLVIGIESKDNSADWCIWDNFQLYYGGDGEGYAFERETAKGNYGTICLPYACKSESAKIYTAAINEDGKTIDLTEVSAMEAGKAYIYQATEDEPIFNITSGAAVHEPVESLPLVGVFDETEVPVGDYVLQTKNGTQAFYKVAEGKKPTLDDYRAYLTVPTSNEAKLNFANATAINALNALVSGTAKIYDLNGRELKSLQKGVNIVNGVKVMVK